MFRGYTNISIPVEAFSVQVEAAQDNAKGRPVLAARLSSGAVAGW